MDNKYYKVIGHDNHSLMAKFDYTPYLPRGKRAGKWLPKIKSLEFCHRGYHITQYWNMWAQLNCKIFEVEYKGRVLHKVTSSSGVEDQILCETIRLVKDVTKKFLDDYKNQNNTGIFNIGIRNAGDRNIGDYNTGYSNYGDFNVGSNNSGNDNVGSYNDGCCNVGSSNIGDFNTGSDNIGNFNTGSLNIGDLNTGDFNIGNNHNGFFNTESPKRCMFNKDLKVPFEQIQFPSWLNCVRNFQFKTAFNNASIADVKLTLKLPNFDYNIFKKITGISKKDFQRKLSRKEQ